ncbi:MFS transporter [Catenuloplanes atrovinosus]|uniref:MFS family permease n=1 Tax=Catenuloplanes atrovinosus TaxID=137266 RepID=A0AAE3YNY5_9ACTN|nr:MFS transporter [Catenuloplanes atrovinosus]MDR7275972.1 MFS family permease [Catenuloplanes atrovinosus]
MHTYGALFRTSEFTPLFAVACAGASATTIGGLALATVVFAATGSPLLSAISMFGPAAAQLLGATLLLSVADRVPPRAALASVAAGSALCLAVLAIPGLPIAAMFGVLGVMGLVASVAGGARLGLLTEILPADGYLLGRSVLNMAVGSVQILGFTVGGALLAVVPPRGVLLLAAACQLFGAVIAALGLRSRPPRASGRPSPAATWRANARLFSSVPRRYVLVALCVPNGLIVGCEALFVPYAPRHAGVLLAAAALGMLAGDILAGRFLPPAWRERAGAFLRLLLAAPYLLFALGLPLWLAVSLTAVASVGYSGTLVLQERLIALTPDDLRGQALGLHLSLMMGMQAVGAGIAGVAAEVLGSAASAITVMAVLSITVTLLVAARVRTPVPRLRTAQADGHAHG